MTEQTGVVALPVTQLVHGRNPREVHVQEADTSLVVSIRTHGVLEPIRVRRIDGDEETYQIIAGHRRFEAAKLAGLEIVPVHVAVTADDTEAFIQDIVSNLERQDLDPIDTAKAFRVLIDETGMTQAELGQRFGWSQPTIANALALLKLTPKVQANLQAGKITVGHAKVMTTMPAAAQEAMTKTIIDDKLTVRDVEAKAAEQRLEATRIAKRATHVKETVAGINKALIDAGYENTDFTVVVPESDFVEPLQKLGHYPVVRIMNWKTDTLHPTWECDCHALHASTYQGFTVGRICVVRAHEQTHRAAQQKELRRVAAEHQRKIEKVARALSKAIREPDLLRLNNIGERLALYVMFDCEGDSARTKAFIERSGGTVPTDPQEAATGAALLEAILGLNAKDLATELAETITAHLLPNVYALTFDYNVDKAVREYFVRSLGMPPEIIRGRPPEDPMPASAYPDPEPAPAEPEETMVEAVDELAPIPAADVDLMALAAEAPPAQSESPDAPAAGPLDGKVIVVTGALELGDRVEIQNLIVKAGAIAADQVTAKTDILVIGDRPGAVKVGKAKVLGITTMTEAEFRKALRG